MRITGASITRAPSALSRRAMSLAWARARVTATVRPASGPASCHAIWPASSLTGPTTVTAGARTPAAVTACASSPSGARTVR